MEPDRRTGEGFACFLAEGTCTCDVVICYLLHFKDISYLPVQQWNSNPDLCA